MTEQRLFNDSQDVKTEGVRMLQFLRALGTEDQRIAYAVLEGMHLQKKLDGQLEKLPARIGAVAK